MNLVAKLFAISIKAIGKGPQEWLLKMLTRLMDFLEKHFNNVIKHMFGIGGAGLAIGEVANVATSIYDGCAEKFSWFTNLLALPTIFNGLNNVLTPYMANTWNCTFLQFFAAFGGISAINTIINSCAYALLFWLAIVVIKWVMSLLPVLIAAIAKAVV